MNFIDLSNPAVVITLIATTVVALRLMWALTTRTAPQEEVPPAE